MLFFTFILGFLSGLLMDKSWITQEEIAFIKKMTAENQLLRAENESWLAFLQEEMSDYEIVLPTKEEPFLQIEHLLTQIGVEVKLLEEFATFEKEGILITFGSDEKLLAGLKQLVLEEVPIAEQDIHQFYLSLLRLKGRE